MKLLNILNKSNKNLHKKLFSTSVKNLKVYDNVNNFNDLINRTDGKPLLVDFTAQWLVVVLFVYHVFIFILYLRVIQCYCCLLLFC